MRSLARLLVAEGHQVEVVHCVDAYRLQRKEPKTVEANDDEVVVHPLRSPFGLLSPLITRMQEWEC